MPISGSLTIITLILGSKVFFDNFVEEWIETWIKDKALVKAYSSIKATEEGIDICFKERQSQKAYFPIEVIEEVIFIFSNTKQHLKILSLIKFAEERKSNCNKNEHNSQRTLYKKEYLFVLMKNIYWRNSN